MFLKLRLIKNFKNFFLSNNLCFLFVITGFYYTMVALQQYVKLGENLSLIEIALFK